MEDSRTKYEKQFLDDLKEAEDLIDSIWGILNDETLHYDPQVKVEKACALIKKWALN